jgi:hypothetical protein
MLPEVQWMVQIQGSVDDLQFLSKIYTEEPAQIQLLCGDYFLSKN